MKRTPPWVFVAAVGVQLAALALCLWAMERDAEAVAEAVAEEEPPAPPPPPPPQQPEPAVHRDALAAARPVAAADAAFVREPQREPEAVRPVQPPEPAEPPEPRETAEASERSRVTVRAVDASHRWEPPRYEPPPWPEPEPRAEPQPRWEPPPYDEPQRAEMPRAEAPHPQPQPRPAVVRVPPPSPVFGPPPERPRAAEGAELLPRFITDPADEVTQIVWGVAGDGRLAFGFYGDGSIRFVDTDGGLYEGKADSARARMREIDGMRAFTVQIGVAEDRRLLASFTGGPHDAESIPLEPAVGWSVA
ncbi:MAG TPA: hypothetical protein VK665_04420 [Candidatus Elarobacter sp.]|nr:hypothetical protein [Candidatus Elarobacter sp.]